MRVFTCNAIDFVNKNWDSSHDDNVVQSSQNVEAAPKLKRTFKIKQSKMDVDLQHKTIRNLDTKLSVDKKEAPS